MLKIPYFIILTAYIFAGRLEAAAEGVPVSVRLHQVEASCKVISQMHAAATRSLASFSSYREQLKGLNELEILLAYTRYESVRRNLQERIMTLKSMSAFEAQEMLWLKSTLELMLPLIEDQGFLRTSTRLVGEIAKAAHSGESRGNESKRSVFFQFAHERLGALESACLEALVNMKQEALQGDGHQSGPEGVPH